MRLYDFIGPERLLADVAAEIPRFRLSADARPADLRAALHLAAQDEATLTYVVDAGGVVWLADRHSEHVACARGGPVRAAGEMTVDLAGGAVAVLSATNQSTGYCPDAACWPALSDALDAVGAARPDGFETAFAFGRCAACRAIAIVKEGDPTCVECGGALRPVREASQPLR